MSLNSAYMVYLMQGNCGCHFVIHTFPHTIKWLFIDGQSCIHLISISKFINHDNYNTLPEEYSIKEHLVTKFGTCVTFGVYTGLAGLLMVILLWVLFTKCHLR